MGRIRISKLLWCVAFAAACTSSPSIDEVPSHTIPSPEQCEAPYQTSVPAPAGIQSATDIRRYDVTARPGAFEVSLLGEGGSKLGDYNTTVDVDVTQEGGIIRYRVDTSYLRDDEVLAEQRWQMMHIGSRMWLDVTHSVENTAFSQWLIFDTSMMIEYRAIAVEVTEEGPNTQLANGRLWDVYELPTEGEVGDEAVEWLRGHVGTVFQDSENWRVFTLLGEDEVPMRAADALVSRCDQAKTGESEQLLTQQSALCPNAVGTSVQATCGGEENGLVKNLQTALQVESFVSATADGFKIVGALVGFGISLKFIWLGLAVGVVIFVAVTVIENKIIASREHVLPPVIHGVGGAFGLETDEVVEFFSGTSETCTTPLKLGQSFNPGINQVAKCNSSGSTATTAKSVKDPHLTTFDRRSYSLHNAGEFVLVRATSGSAFEVQARHEPASSAICSGVAFNTAAAIRVGDSRVTFAAPGKIWIDGVRGQIGVATPLAHGGFIERAGVNDYIVRHPAGDAVFVEISTDHLDISVAIAETRKGRVEGLFGNANGNSADDIALPGGQLLTQPIAWTDMRDRFGEAWRVSASSSLFDYESGESSSTFAIPGFPLSPTLVEDLPQEDQDRAAVACADVSDANAYQDCLLDVACMGDPSLAEAHERRDTGEAVELTYPNSLDGWMSPDQNGEWRVSADKTMVTRIDSGSPSFFVSDEDLFDVTIRGTLRNNAQNNDDIVGFVLGYQTPLAEDDPEDELRTLVLSWKARATGQSPEGFVLYQLDGSVPPLEYTRAMWDLDESSADHAARTILARHTGEGLGWAAHTDVPFEITYSADRLVVIIGGEVIFDITAASSPVAFEPGRFGFYAFSQQSVAFRNVVSEPAGADPTESLDGLDVGVDLPGNTLRTVAVDVADPRPCRELCRADAACEAFVYTRPVFQTSGASCELKSAASQGVADDSVISGKR